MSEVRLSSFALAAVVALGLSAAGDAFADSPPWLGVAMDKAPKGGVLVTHVVSGSPAEKAGVHAGDKIEKVDGTVVWSASDVQHRVAEHHTGDVVAVTVTRDLGPVTVQVKIAPRPTMDEVLRMDHVGKPAPEWRSVEAASKGAPTSIASLKGKVTVVDFWATWCGACRYSAPELTRLQAKFAAQGVTVVGITTDSKSDAAEFAARTNMGYAVVADATGRTTEDYSVTALPTVYVVDKKGVVRDVSIGFAPDSSSKLETLITQLLAEPGP